MGKQSRSISGLNNPDIFASLEQFFGLKYLNFLYGSGMEKFEAGMAVLRIRDVYPGSRILIFTDPGSRIQKQQQKRGVKIFDVIRYLFM
jgi:hypothetical protein